MVWGASAVMGRGREGACRVVMMAEADALLTDDIRALQKLLEVLEGFVLVYVFVDVTAQRDFLRQSIADALRLRAAYLDVISIDSKRHIQSGDALIDAAWGAISATSTALHEKKCPLWLEADAHGEEWDLVRRQLLSRLNESRHRLETAFARPLVLVFPASFKNIAAEVAPDLWSVRKMVIDIDPVTAAQTNNYLPTQDVNHAQSRTSAQAILALDPEYQVLQAEFATLQAQADAGKPFNLNSAFRLVDYLVLAGDPRALLIAKQVNEMADKNIALASGADGGRYALRDLSISWERIGDAASALGRQEEALSAYREGKRIREQIVGQYGENREALRDLSISWERIGDAARALGRQEEALSAYQEACMQLDKFQQMFGENVDTLTNVTMLLNKRKVLNDATLTAALDVMLDTNIKRLCKIFPENAHYKKMAATLHGVAGSTNL
jgi:Tetratricopeptide repeat